ncbi:hypothetical protein F5883DRAFT_169007 [Diaporthe sp. PMI_573]|nr:hypothetical protein F5883DRAFT_169007 [Diaporthaceae sp. PMI_573]
MAEVLGAVASGLALAEVGLKVGGTVWKLKMLWQQVHEVPQTIRDLMRQIEIMDPILSDHETYLDVQGAGFLEHLPTHHGSTVTPSAEYCREALNNLRRLVEDLNGAIESEKRSRRTFARMRVVLKKDTIKGFQDRLAMAIELLQLAQVTYLTANAVSTRAMITNIWSAVADLQQQLSNNSSSSTERPPFPVTSQHLETSPVYKQNGVQRQRSQIFMPWSEPSILGTIVVGKSREYAENDGETTYVVRFQLPKWLSQKVWNVSVNRACSGWQMTLWTCNIVPADSPGFRCIWDGDLDGLIDLFNRGLASPRDCDPTGLTLFHQASIYSETHIVQYFINKNLDTVCPNLDAKLAFLVLVLSGKLPVDVKQQLVSRGLCNSLVSEVEDFEFWTKPVDQSTDQVFSIFFLFMASHKPVLDIYFRTCFPFCHDLPPKRKQEILMLAWSQGLCFVAEFHRFELWNGVPLGACSVDALRFVICPDGHVQPVDVQAWIDDGASILHNVFYFYLNSLPDSGHQNWERLLEEAIEATDDVHHRMDFSDFGYKGTRSALEWALVTTLEDILYYAPQIFGERAARRALKRTLGKLQALMSVLTGCGYNLAEFGRQEAVVWVSAPLNSKAVGDVLYLGIGDWCDGLPFVKAVHYGAEPRDWYFEMDFHYENYAGDFWHLLENPHLFMVPGAWVD